MSDVAADNGGVVRRRLSLTIEGDSWHELLAALDELHGALDDTQSRDEYALAYRAERVEVSLTIGWSLLPDPVDESETS